MKKDIYYISPLTGVPTPKENESYAVEATAPDRKTLLHATIQWEPRPDSKYLYCYVYKRHGHKVRKAYAGSQRTITTDRLRKAIHKVNGAS